MIPHHQKLLDLAWGSISLNNNHIRVRLCMVHHACNKCSIIESFKWSISPILFSSLFNYLTKLKNKEIKNKYINNLGFKILPRDKFLMQLRKSNIGRDKYLQCRHLKWVSTIQYQPNWSHCLQSLQCLHGAYLLDISLDLMQSHSMPSSQTLHTL